MERTRVVCISIPENLLEKIDDAAFLKSLERLGESV